MMYWIPFKTIVTREYTRFLRIWTQTLLPPVITMSLYFVIFGHFIGSRLGAYHGFTFMQFLAPGLIMMSVITGAYGNVSSSFFGTKFSHCVEEMMVAPLPSHIIIGGYVMGGVGRGLLVGGLVTLVALLFTHLTILHPFFTVAVLFCCAVLFSLAGFLNALFAKKFDDVAFVPTFVLTPLTYLGGVFYSVTLLPEPWRHISYFNPVLYLVNAFRYGILGYTDVSLWVACMLLTVTIATLYGVNWWLLEKGVGLRQ